MTGKIIYLAENDMIDKIHNQKDEFKNAVLLGLSKVDKQLPSKYFYDDRGCELFDQITQHADYYLTRCELEILDTYKEQLSNLLNTDSINLIELGPGEGIKTQILIKQFLKDALHFTYSPIDISSKYLRRIVKQFNRSLPTLALSAIHADYFKGLEWLSITSERRNLVLFLGSSIGNFDLVTTSEFLRHIWALLHDGDYILIGFDLRKDINLLLRAYSDHDGITRDFNLNLFSRINAELGANFALAKFAHYATYNVYRGAMESYLVSLAEQTIDVEALGLSFTFQPFEPIHVEYSHKYLLSQIEQFAYTTGFEIIQNFTDSKQYFVDSLWRVHK